MPSHRTRWTPIPLRLGVGTIMTVHGLGKLGLGPLASPDGVAGFAETLAALGVPLAAIAAWAVTLLEFVGGLFVLAGLFVRYVSLLMAANMTVATLLVHLPNGFAVSDGGFEFTVLLALASLSLVLSGPGTLSLERAVLGHEYRPLSSGAGDERTA
ncbi:DoxX family protein [Halorientalis salina]|uniref:DoxX family protein n=1 Tax=Halorientalis salina TaxID=2932266 RepID=UPI0010ABA43F|nr:DoxX family protein [Halorientalis salina]